VPASRPSSTTAKAVVASHRVAIDAIREPFDHPALLSEVAAGRALALPPRSFTALRGLLQRCARR